MLANNRSLFTVCPEEGDPACPTPDPGPSQPAPQFLVTLLVAPSPSSPVTLLVLPSPSSPGTAEILPSLPLPPPLQKPASQSAPPPLFPSNSSALPSFSPLCCVDVPRILQFLTPPWKEDYLTLRLTLGSTLPQLHLGPSILRIHSAPSSLLHCLGQSLLCLVPSSLRLLWDSRSLQLHQLWDSRSLQLQVLSPINFVLAWSPSSQLSLSLHLHPPSLSVGLLTVL